MQSQKRYKMRYELPDLGDVGESADSSLYLCHWEFFNKPATVFQTLNLLKIAAYNMLLYGAEPNNL
jgi:hypothetical protein